MTFNLNKIYSNLTEKQLAVMAFGLISQKDYAGFKLIEAQVPINRYECLSTDYRHKFNEILQKSLFWGAQFWKLQFSQIYLISQFKEELAAEGNNLEWIAISEAQVDLCNAKISALYLAGQEFCQEGGIEFEGFINLTDAPMFEIGNINEPYYFEIKQILDIAC